MAVIAFGCGGDDSAGTTLTTFPSATDTGDDGNITSGIDPTGLDDGDGSGDAASSEDGVDDTSSSGSPSDESSSGGDSTTGEPSACDEIDEPDVNGQDENGDGIDGVLGCSVFVNATVGSDLNGGLVPEEPVLTIARGIEIASTFNPPRPVLVAAATYGETVNLDTGVSLYGGYEPSSWERDHFANETIIDGTEDRTLIAINLTQATEVDGFTILGHDYADGGESTYAVWVRDTPEGFLRIDYCAIYGGVAGSGTDSLDGVAGEDGGNGTSATDGNGGAGGVSGCGATGGEGGDGTACPSQGGGDGVAGGSPTTPGPGGAAGGSVCGSDCDDEGTDASPGDPGSVGVNGEGGLSSSDGDGSFGGDGLWIPPAGDVATAGDNGSGGGGGGAGGYDVDNGVFCTFDSGNGIGGGGGGGGAGGCGGDAGPVGTPGGASFCLVAMNSSIEVSNTDFFLGTGGDGGSGGDGGNGGIPGQPGSGASGIDQGGEPGDGREGAAGGGGGGGGGGAGGCGGSAVGIATVAGAAVAVGNVSYTGGTAGAPGLGGIGGIRADGVGLNAPSGQDGCNGVVSDTVEYE